MPPRRRISRSMYGKGNGTRRRSSRARRVYGGKRRSRKYSGRNLRGGQPIKVYVKYQYKNRDLSFEMITDPDDTFYQWKNDIYYLTERGVEIDQQKYVLDGNRVVGDDTRMGNLVKNGDTLHMVVGRDADERWGDNLKRNIESPMRRIPF